MVILCTHSFQQEYFKLIKKNSYKGLEQDLIGYFFNKTAQQLKAATSLNGPLQETVNPFLKKRLDGKGGFRVYYYIIVDSKVIISAVHPKSGALGRENLSSKEILSIMKNAIAAHHNQNLLELSITEGKLVFT